MKSSTGKKNLDHTNVVKITTTVRPIRTRHLGIIFYNATERRPYIKDCHINSLFIAVKERAYPQLIPRCSFGRTAFHCIITLHELFITQYIYLLFVLGLVSVIHQFSLSVSCYSNQISKCIPSNFTISPLSRYVVRRITLPWRRVSQIIVKSHI